MTDQELVVELARLLGEGVAQGFVRAEDAADLIRHITNDSGRWPTPPPKGDPLGYLKARGVVKGTEPAEDIIRRIRGGAP